MNPQDPLANLHPLRDPPPIDWWPPAPGWWLLLALLLLLAGTAAWLLWRRYRRNAYRRQGLRQLEELRQQENANGQDFATAVNALLKSVALRAYPRRDVAASSGKDWLAFLAETADGGATLPEELADGPYRPSTAIDTDALYRGAYDWIRNHRPAPKETAR